MSAQVPNVDRKLKKDRESDIKYALQYTRCYLNCIGIWTFVSLNPTRIERLASLFVMPYCAITMIIVLVPPFLHFALHDVKMTEYMLLLAPLCRAVSNIVEYYILLFHKGLIRSCVHQIEEDWRRIDSHVDREIAIKSLRKGRSLNFFFAIPMYSSAVFYSAVMPFVTGTTINELNQTVRPLIFPGYDIVIDLEAGYNYPIAFFFGSISCVLHFTISNTVFNLISVFVIHTSGQFEIIMSRLKNLTEETDAAHNRIAFVIRRHITVLKFTSRISKLFQEICFIEVIAATVIICLIEYSCLVEWRNENKIAIITFGIIFVAMMFNIFIYCYIGELLKEQCEAIGKAAYMIEWYRLPEKSGLALVMVMIMSKYPRVLTAGRIVEMSIATFCSIAKSSFAYFGILKALDEE